MVKKFIDLSEEEKTLTSDFLNRNSKNKKTLDEFEKAFMNRVYDHGNGILFYFENGEIIGKVNVVLESIEATDASYIFHADILESVENKGLILKELIESGKALAKEYGTKKIFFGMLNEATVKLAESIGLYKSYSAFEMILENRELYEDTLDLIPLSEENLHEYVSLSNSSFNDIPHGGCITFDKAKSQLEEVDEKNCCFIVAHKGTNLGVMEIMITDNNEGFFDIGLVKAYRGKGYGKKLLETAINFLVNKGVEKVCLIVIEKNKVAYDMYKKRGFVVSKVMSDWTTIF